MSLAEELAGDPPSALNNTCLLCDALGAMDGKDRDAVIEAVYGTRWTDRQVLERLHAAGFTYVRKSSLANHRQNDHSGVR